MDQMNLVADRIFCKDFNFVNPHGMYERNHFASALDVCRLMNAAMEFELIRDVL